MTGSRALGILMPQPQGFIVVLVGLPSIGSTWPRGCSIFALVSCEPAQPEEAVDVLIPRGLLEIGGMSKTGNGVGFYL